ncbi:hypothetical protein BBJ28_00001615 [Nothophytophthora sp. Chile5]|nr:hypothetical protein BBJ28_00001615 [Nothophytophthora sp. Chile5]
MSRTSSTQSTRDDQGEAKPAEDAVVPGSSLSAAKRALVDALVQKEALRSLKAKLKQTQELRLLSAQVVHCQIFKHQGRQVVKFKLQIKTDSRGFIHVWHRYSTFLKLAEMLQLKSGHKRSQIPELPGHEITSEPAVQERVETLNRFLEAVTRAESLEWGIRIDEHTYVSKRRVKTAVSVPIPAREGHEVSSPLKYVARLLPLKTTRQRQRGRKDAVYKLTHGVAS